MTFIRSADGWLRVEPLFQPAEAAAWDRDDFAQRLLRHPVYRDQVLGADGKTCCFVVPLDPLSVSPENRSRLVTFLRQYFEGITEPGQEFRLDGIVVTKDTVLGLMASDSRVYYPTALLALIVMLLLLFRNLAAAMLTTLVVSLSVLWTLGFMALTGIPLNLVSTAMPVLILVAGVGDAVHLLTRFRQLLNVRGDARAALSEAVSEVGLACLLTSITTAAGFWSLSLAGVAVLREFGLPVGVGIMSAWVISFALLPPAILGLKTLSRIHVRPAGESLLGKGCWWLVSRHTGKVVAVSALVLAVALAMVPRVRVESRMLEDFGDDSPLQQTRRFVEERMGGVSTLEVILRRPADALPALAGGVTGAAGAGSADGRMLDPDVLTAVDRLEERLREPALADLGVLNSLAITDYVKDMLHILSEREPGSFVLPETRAGAAQLLLLYEGARPSDPTEDFLRAPHLGRPGAVGGPGRGEAAGACGARAGTATLGSGGGERDGGPLA